MSKSTNTALNYDLILVQNVTFTQEDVIWLEDAIAEIFVEDENVMQFYVGLAQTAGFAELVQASRNIWNTNSSIDSMVITLITRMYRRWNITEANLPFFLADMTPPTSTSLSAEVSNHPVHLVSETGRLLPSCFIPYCAFGGNMSAVGKHQVHEIWCT